MDGNMKEIRLAIDDLNKILIQKEKEGKIKLEEISIVYEIKQRKILNDQ